MMRILKGIVLSIALFIAYWLGYIQGALGPEDES